MSCWVSVTPGAVGSTRNRSTSSRRRRCAPSTTSRGRRRCERRRATSRRRARSRRRRPSRVACTPRGPKPLSGSSQAVVRIASPETILGSHSCFCSSVPRREQHARAHRPRSRSGATARARDRAPRRRPRPRAALISEPPYSAGTIRPMRSSSASCFHSSGGIADGVVLQRAHGRRASAYELHTPRTISRSISCSSVKSRSIVVLLDVALVVTAPLVAAAASRGCRRRSSGSAIRAVQSVLRSPSTERRHEHRRPAAAGVVGLDVARRCPRAPSCRRGTPSPSCGTSCARAGPSVPDQSVR